MTNNQNPPAPDALGNLRRLAYFVAVVETGSFTAAGDRLGVTKAVVSQQVARLEREYATTLLVRTTRKVQATEAGQAFYGRCASILREAELAFDGLADTAAEPSGLLRLTAPFDYGVDVVVPAIAAFTSRYPACRVDAVLSDQTLDMMARHVEVAIRVGWLADSGLQARKIGVFRQVLVAAPALRHLTAPLNHPDQLGALPFVANTALREHLTWHFSLAAKKGSADTAGTADTANTSQAVTMKASIFLDATLAVREAVRVGAGLSVLPDYAISDDLAAGRLIEVLPAWQLPSGGIHAVFPAARFRPAKVRAFVDLLAEREQRRLAG